VWRVDGSAPFRAHAGSVEDLQWSPNEANVFASCGVDGTVRIWDARAKGAGGSRLSVAAHGCDCNVISWSPLISFLLASGADDGAFKVWDLRAFAKGEAIAHFKWHRKAVTSIEWNPHDENELCVASSDNSVSLWDLSLEGDDEAELALAGGAAAAALPSSKDPRLAAVPPQLLFLHQGQTDNKEAHFHPQLPGVVLSVAQDGLNVWKPDVVTTT
jgi:ribosome assembly protein RRB1